MKTSELLRLLKFMMVLSIIGLVIVLLNWEKIDLFWSISKGLVSWFGLSMIAACLTVHYLEWKYGEKENEN